MSTKRGSIIPMTTKVIPDVIAAIAPDGKLTPVQRRRILIDICRRHIRPGTGSASEFLRKRSAMIAWPDLRSILGGIPWAVIGAVATRTYMPERMTKDMDILVRQQDAGAVRERLAAAGYVFAGRLALPGIIARSPEDVEVDVILGDYPWQEEALTQLRQDPAGYPVLDLPYLVIMKMAASRGRDIGDVTTMLGLASDEELARVRDVVKRHAPTELQDLESLIYLGKLEMQEPGDRPAGD
jgi:hypothetical protein